MYFDNCIDIDDAKAKYRTLSKMLHPDKGGDAEIMKEVNLSFHDWVEKFSNEPPEGSTFRIDPLLEKLDMILTWSELPENRYWNPHFVRSLKHQYMTKNGWLSEPQQKSIDSIIDCYGIGA